ncbi:glycoside hydrolase family 6 protein [Pseudoduganella sp. OTU4001]|uniref:glycoside hydrolase family 6 protein n=1 Tax=Pseudoduganella sp. OTU4001 TaxID=3043854 RepID=UPI00313CA1EB
MNITTKLWAAAAWLTVFSLAHAEALPAPATAAFPGLYVDPQSSAVAWVRDNPADQRAADIARHIASQPGARWFGGWSGDIASAVGQHVANAAQAQRTPVMVAYNIPNRDCGQHSAGGERSMQAYQNWVHAFAKAIGERPAIVILEPDALPQLDCLDAQGKAERVQLFQFAVQAFYDLAPRTLLYIDIGNSDWLPPAEAAKRLLLAGVASAQGFSLNVSNYRADSESRAYGIAVTQALQAMAGLSKSFVVDTSRNGAGPNGKQWCDAAGRKLGQLPRIHGAGSQPEMSLWIKAPGESDGCAGPAGSFMPELAHQLIGGH